MNTNASAPFTASVSNTSNTAVSWSLSGAGCAGATCGTLDSTTANPVTYTAPGAVPNPAAVTLKAAAQADGTKSASATITIVTSGGGSYPGTFTAKNDEGRTGQNRNETTLTPANVNSSRFGKLFSCPVDGYVYTQPLYVANVSIGGGVHNVVYVGTEHDSVYAFDADNRSCQQLWRTSFINPPSVTPVPAADVEGEDIGPEIGITGTPVIDPTSNKLYVVARTKENGLYFHRLHALDITTGAERPGSPVVINATVPGSGYDSVAGTITFNTLTGNERPALLLKNGIVYFAFGALSDLDPYHGWVFGYNAATLQLAGLFVSTRNGKQGGVWQSGAGLSADPNGNIYAVTGNGTFDQQSGGLSCANPLAGCDFGDTVLKLSPSLTTVTDFFTPFNQADLEAMDLDVGSTTALVLPDQPGPHLHLLLVGGKEGKLYLLDRDSLGRFHAGDDSQIVQSFLASFPGIFNTPAIWENNVYVGGRDDSLKLFRLQNGQFNPTTPFSETNKTFSYPGVNPTISSNGSTNGIVWALETGAFATHGPAILHAYDATNLANELYSSTDAGARDQAGPAVKFMVPTVANGKVYIGTQTELTVYGPLP